METLTFVLIVVAAFGWITNFLIFSEKQELARKHKDEMDQIILDERIKMMDHAITNRIEDLERGLNYWREDIDTRLMKVEIDTTNLQRAGKQK
jgi:hypothetical protein